MEQLTQEILEKYLDNKATFEEQVIIEQSLRSAGELQSVKGIVENRWTDFDDKEWDEIDLSHVLQRVKGSIIADRKTTESVKRRIYNFYSKVAAILLLPLLITSLISNFKLDSANKLLTEKSTIASIQSPLGTRMEFSLPDGSRGYLNGGSKIEYQVPFNTNRQVRLEGEAYFDVKKDKFNVFEVIANNIKVKVVGTRFNINSYKEDGMSEVVLEEGAVECFVQNHNEVIMLRPNESVKVEATGVIKSKVTASDYIEWKDGRMSFRKSSMDEVKSKLESWYNVEIEILDEELYSYKLKGTFDNETLEDVLNLLKMTSPINYKINKRQKLEDGTYSKTKVIIFKQG